MPALELTFKTHIYNFLTVIFHNPSLVHRSGQWRSEGGGQEGGGAAAHGRRLEGGAKMLQKFFKNLYIEKFLKI